MRPYHELFPLLLCPSGAEMEGREDGGVTGRFGQSGECLSPRQAVAEQPCRRGSLRRRLSVEAVGAEADVWLRVVLSWKRQARAQHSQQPDSRSSCTDGSRTQHVGESGMYENHTKDTNNCNEGLLSDEKRKLFHAIKRIKHEVDECREAEIETHIESVQVENSFDALEREIRAEFQNLHRFLDEEECKDLERLSRERQKQLKQLKERNKKITEQGRDLDRAITVLNSKLAEENSPTLLREIQDLIKRQVLFT
ncbi:uncharacterized protein LOC116386674 [Anarrhichthys ocellatus]|uniref:uncharacterized protein LOC116386674 n=1 Tax=Anarrhichthys ocellatus TaxID=433405 RepID=UPI0012EE58A9|nr:uncharacterized protein LOC116386674 [Anarrhichthys ocellatus]